jgi:hypothetical protein
MRRDTCRVFWVRAQAVRWVDDEPQPGWVEFHLQLADGTVAQLFDKPPVVDRDDHLRPDSAYPVRVTLACAIEPSEVASHAAVPGAVLVTLAHGVSNQSGVSTFWVREQDVVSAGD